MTKTGGIGLLSYHAWAAFVWVLTSSDSNLHVGDKDGLLNIVAAVTLLSHEGQKMVSILTALQHVPRLSIELFAIPEVNYTTAPITRYYRHVWADELAFTSEGRLEAGPAAQFTDIPEDPVFTMNLHTPHAWVVVPTYCIYDLDNVHLADLREFGHGIEAAFLLQYVLLEGTFLFTHDCMCLFINHAG